MGRILHAYAHCDIPCGIYDPHGAQLAALTVLRMHQLIGELPKPTPDMTAKEREAYVHQLARYTRVKDDHAEQCKQELRILWGDYFTPEHVEQFPKLHQLFWEAMKLASKTRQHIDMVAAQELLAAVQQIAETFWKTKGATTHRQPSLQKAEGELVYPSPKVK